MCETHAALLLRRAAHEMQCEADAVERGLCKQVTHPKTLRRMAAGLRDVAEKIAPGFRGV